MLRFLPRSLLLVTLAFLSASLQAHANSNIALVIGNSAYRHVPQLPNPRNDADDMAAALTRLNFSVTRFEDLGFDEMRRALLDFGRKARHAEIAILYFAGHGVEMGGENWLIPIDAELRTDADIEQEALALKGVMQAVGGASKLGLVILDACRNNPFAAKMHRTSLKRAVERGLARVEPTGSVLVAFAAKDGTTADDGDGRNSPFTRALLKYIDTPGLEVNFLFRRVRDDVLAATQREQEPFVYGSLSHEELFLSVPVIGLSRPTGPSADTAAWDIVSGSGNAAQLKRFIEKFPLSSWRPQAEAQLSKLTKETPSKSKKGRTQPPGKAANAPIGRVYRNKATGTVARAQIVRNFRNAQGQQCRTVRQTVRLADGNVVSDTVSACRVSNAIGWEVVR